MVPGLLLTQGGLQFLDGVVAGLGLLLGLCQLQADLGHLLFSLCVRLIQALLEGVVDPEDLGDFVEGFLVLVLERIRSAFLPAHLLFINHSNQNGCHLPSISYILIPSLAYFPSSRHSLATLLARSTKLTPSSSSQGTVWLDGPISWCGRRASIVLRTPRTLAGAMREGCLRGSAETQLRIGSIFFYRTRNFRRRASSLLRKFLVR